MRNNPTDARYFRMIEKHKFTLRWHSMWKQWEVDCYPFALHFYDSNLGLAVNRAAEAVEEARKELKL